MQYISKFGTYTESGGGISTFNNAMTGFVRRVGDAMSGILSLGGNRITDVSSPTNPYDAANKKYVDSSKLLFTSCNATSKNTTDWIRMFTITGTEGSTISLNVLEKNTSGNGALQAFVRVNRAYNGSYSYVIFPWASGTLNIAINYGEIWCKKNFSGITPLIANVSWFSNGETTTIKPDGVTTSNNNPSGFIDTSQGSKLYIGPSTTIISGVTDPINAQDAATKKYVDTLNHDAASKSYVTSQIDTRLNKGGDAMSGELNMNNQRIVQVKEPRENWDAVPKTYVDSKVIGSRTMRGTINMNNHKITNLPTPENDADAASKLYVDLHKPKVDIYKIQNATTATCGTLSLRPTTGSVYAESISLPPGLYRFTIAGSTPWSDDRGDVEFWLGNEKVQRAMVKYPNFQLVVILYRPVNSVISLKGKCTSSEPLELTALTLIIETFEQ